MRTQLLILAAASVTTTTAVAQIPFVDQIFSKVQDVNTSLGAPRLNGSQPGVRGRHLRSVNFEVTIYVGETWCRDTLPGPDSTNLCRKPTTNAAKVDSLKRCARGEFKGDRCNDLLKHYKESKRVVQ